jgi:hypothetical protein
MRLSHILVFRNKMLLFPSNLSRGRNPEGGPLQAGRRVGIGVASARPDWREASQQVDPERPACGDGLVAQIKMRRGRTSWAYCDAAHELCRRASAGAGDL